MVIPYVKGIFTPYIYDLQKYKPESDSFCLSVEVIIGQENKEGEELFYLQIASLAYLGEKIRESGSMFGHSYLIVNGFDYDNISETLGQYCRDAASNTWEEVSLKLRRVMDSEFTDYYDAHVRVTNSGS
jgi:hypothetical protein